MGQGPTLGLMCLKGTHHYTAWKVSAPPEISASLGRPSGHRHPASAPAHIHPRGAPIFSQTYKLHLFCALWLHQSQSNSTPHHVTESDSAPPGSTDVAHGRRTWLRITELRGVATLLVTAVTAEQGAAWSTGSNSPGWHSAWETIQPYVKEVGHDSRQITQSVSVGLTCELEGSGDASWKKVDCGLDRDS